MSPVLLISPLQKFYNTVDITIWLTYNIILRRDKISCLTGLPINKMTLIGAPDASFFDCRCISILCAVMSPYLQLYIYINVTVFYFIFATLRLLVVSFLAIYLDCGILSWRIGIWFCSRFFSYINIYTFHNRLGTLIENLPCGHNKKIIFFLRFRNMLLNE